MDDSKEKYSRLTANRYQVVDPVCGLVETCSRKVDAFALALKHSQDCNEVEILDTAAKGGAPERWNSSGRVLNRRESKIEKSPKCQMCHSRDLIVVEETTRYKTYKCNVCSRTFSIVFQYKLRLRSVNPDGE